MSNFCPGMMLILEVQPCRFTFSWSSLRSTQTWGAFVLYTILLISRYWYYINIAIWDYVVKCCLFCFKGFISVKWCFLLTFLTTFLFPLGPYIHFAEDYLLKNLIVLIFYESTNMLQCWYQSIWSKTLFYLILSSSLWFILTSQMWLWPTTEYLAHFIDIPRYISSLSLKKYRDMIFMPILHSPWSRKCFLKVSPLMCNGFPETWNTKSVHLTVPPCFRYALFTRTGLK